jgi:hypothetical protein
MIVNNQFSKLTGFVVIIVVFVMNRMNKISNELNEVLAA